MLNQSRALAYGCVITSLLASAVSGDQCLHVEYNRLSFLFSSIFVLKDSHLAIFFADIRILLEMQNCENFSGFCSPELDNFITYLASF